jgi:hypothetical protein
MLSLARRYPGHVLGGLAFGVALVGVVAALVIRFPTFDVSPAVPQAGQPFTVDASVAAAGLHAPVRYEWDLDDDPTRADGFERATGTLPVARTTFVLPGDRRLRVRLIGADGETKEISKLIHVDG